MAEERPPPEDSHRHLRCRGMTSQGFPLEMPILTLFGGMTGRYTYITKGDSSARRAKPNTFEIKYTLFGNPTF